MTAPPVAWSSLRPAAMFELEALDGLPCGCVSVAYRTRPWGFLVAVLEAKGPYCTHAGHTVGQILHLSDPVELEPDEDVGSRPL